MLSINKSDVNTIMVYICHMNKLYKEGFPGIKDFGKNQKKSNSGVYMVKCKETDVAIIGTSSNVSGILRRIRLDLSRNSLTSHYLLQEEYNQYPDSFEYFILERAFGASEMEFLKMKLYWAEQLALSGVVFCDKIVITNNVQAEPEPLRPIFAKIEDWLDRGMISEKQLENACLQIMGYSF